MIDPSPCILIDPKGNPTAPVRDLLRQNYSGGLAHLIGIFESVATLKERVKQTRVYEPDSSRRITWIKPDSDQHFLAERKLFHGQSFGGNTSLIDACRRMKDSFSDPSKSAVYIIEEGSPARLSENFDPRKAHPLVYKRELFIPDRIAKALLEKQICMDVEFIAGLTTPPKNVPLEEILDFKTRKNAEYEAFWDCIRSTANDIEFFNSEGKRNSLQKRLSRDLGDYEKATAENWPRRVANSAKFSFVVDGSLVTSFATIGAFWQYFGTNPLILVAGAIGSIKFSLNLRPAIEPLNGCARAMSYAANLKQIR